jgi:chorismate dehydratase
LRVSPHPALAGLRIGCVKYLNARPLIHTYAGDVRFEHPSELARALAAGDLDAALVPVFELFRGRGYQVVDGAAIASDGPVYSVILAYEGEITDVRRVALDPASLTSIHLLQVLLAEQYGVRPEFVDAREDAGGVDAQLLIGNQAIAFRQSVPAAVQILDLGGAWKEFAGLPFVYAVWLLRPGLGGAAAIGDAFRLLRQEGIAEIHNIVRSEQTFSPQFALSYLTEHIRFDLGAGEKAGLLRFGELLWKHGFISSRPGELKFV